MQNFAFAILPLTFCLFYPSPLSPPGISLEPRFSWFTMESPHFSIHFPCKGHLTSERLQFITQLAQTAEGIRQTFLTSGISVPVSKTQLVVADYYDYYNGYATPFPDNTVVIMPFTPGPEKANSEDWLRLLLLHEYSHIVQLDQCHGLPLILRRIFGRVIVPNALMPLWLIEGYAVYNESRFSGFGRERSAEWRSILLTAAQKGRLLPLDRCTNYELQRYPSALAPYIYGSSFFAHLAKRNGDTIWEVFNRQHSKQLPFFDNVAAKRVFGTNFAALYQEWQNQLIRQKDSQLSTITEKPALNQITFEGFNTSSPIWSRNGTEIYFVSASDRERRAIKAFNLGTNISTTLHEGEVTGSLSLSPDGRYLAFAELFVKGQGYVQGDIFFYDLFQGKVKRITFDERARDPDFAPDRPAVIYVSNDSGKSRLVILNYETGERTVLAEMSGLDYFHQPRFSPEGGLVAVGVWRESGYADIEIIDLNQGWVIPITQDRACDLFPSWSRTGKVLFFVSDRSGVYNLYAFAVETRKLYRCTDVLGGVFQPAVSPNNKKIAVTALGPEGYDINLMDFVPREWQPASEHLEFGISQAPDCPVDSFASAVYYYNPMPSVLPRFWLPWLTFDSGIGLGIFTMGWDVLRFHRYQVVATYQGKQRTPQLNFSYELHQYPPVFQFTGNWSFKRQNSRLGVEMPIYRTRDYQAFGIGANLNHDSLFSLLFDGFYRFSNARRFRFCVEPVQGRSFDIIAIAESRQLVSPHNRLRAVVSWKEYLGNPPANWSLSPRVAIGVSYGDSSRFNAFAFTNQNGPFVVRGFTDSSRSGANILAGGLQFRTPFSWVERGLGIAPVFLSNINAALFADAGMTLDEIRRGIKDYRIGLGAEMGFDFVLAYYVPVRFSAGLALGLKKPVTHQFYIQVKSEVLEGVMINPFNPVRFSRE